MANMDDACGVLQQQVNGAVLCAIVDLDSGIIVGMHPTGAERRALATVVSASAIRLVRGAVVGDLVTQLSTSESAASGYLEEAQLTTPEHIVFCRTVSEGRALAVLVTTRDVSVGMGWAQLKAALPEFEEVVY